MRWSANLASTTLLLVVALAARLVAAPQGGALPEFAISPFFGEQVRVLRPAAGVRVVLNAPPVKAFHLRKPTRIVFYATPNGNTIEQTLGCRTSPGLDWHFGIQHVAAQVRHLRSLEPAENLVLACVEAEGLSWPSWRSRRTGGAAEIRKIVADVTAALPGREKRLTVAGHSGGGSFLWGYLDGGPEIPDRVDRIIFLDANYSYDDGKGHGAKLISWLRRSRRNHLVVIAYDDREVMFKGKRVVGPTGGTFRACQRMLGRFGKDLEIEESQGGFIEGFRALDGRFTLLRHLNPENRILHTALVGDMSGLAHALSLGTRLAGEWGSFGGARTWSQWIQPVPGTGVEASVPDPGIVAIPPRPKDAPEGRDFLRSTAELPLLEREQRIVAEVERGNVPAFLRALARVEVRGKDAKGRQHRVELAVMPDYLAVGSDRDCVRVPLTPMAAQRIADRFGFTLPTRKMVDEIHRSAAVKLSPRPLTEERQAVTTFLEHDAVIESQKKGHSRKTLVSGIKKDIVLTPLLASKPGRVAIYGWHRLSGKPIQPLYTGHIATYVDYSHGVRLVARTIRLDGKKVAISRVLADPVLHPLLSDEGLVPLSGQRYRP